MVMHRVFKLHCLGLAREELPRIKVISLLEVLSALLGSISICHCLFVCKRVCTLCAQQHRLQGAYVWALGFCYVW